jgi:hypothetical protein
MKRFTTRAAIAATALTLAFGIPATMTPAAAQDSSNVDSFEPYDSGPFDWRDRNVDQRGFGAGTYSGPQGRQGPYGMPYRQGYDSAQAPDYGRTAYDRGYRMGRDDERRAWSDQDRDVSAGLEYLDIARQRLDRGDLRAAWVALGRAETRFITRAIPRGTRQEAATGAAVGAIRDARDAIEDRQIDRARTLTDRAMSLANRGMLVGRNVPGSALGAGGDTDWQGARSWGGGRGG